MINNDKNILMVLSVITNTAQVSNLHTYNYSYQCTT